MFNDRIVELNNLHVGLQAIADDIGVYRKTLSKWCKQEGIDINPKTYTRTCEHCNKTYRTISKASRFCSDKCRVDNNHVRYYNTDVEVECSCCGRSMTVNTVRAKRDRVITCEQCKSDENELSKLIGSHSNIYYQQCKHCDKQWITKRNQVYKYCSGECRRKDNYKPVIYKKKCAECSNFFDTTRTRKKFCCVECSNRYKHRADEYRRRIKMIENGEVHWSISIERLLKRDGNKCYICNELMNKGSDYNDDDYPNIEHVKPLSKGGTHTWDNVKLAHRKCNMEKGIKELSEIISE